MAASDRFLPGVAKTEVGEEDDDTCAVSEVAKWALAIATTVLM